MSETRRVEYCIGDVHGKFAEYGALIERLPSSIQLGDMGLGFRPNDELPSRPNHYFIRGNHDNPAICQKQVNFLGNAGITQDGYFFMSGAESIDRNMRVEGFSWWRDEELTTAQFNEAFGLYKYAKPEVVLTHTCPSLAMETILGPAPGKPSATSVALSACFNLHRPKLWVLAHFHRDMEFDLHGTQFVVLDELSVYQMGKGYVNSIAKEDSGI